MCHKCKIKKDKHCHKCKKAKCKEYEKKKIYYLIKNILKKFLL